MCHTVKTKSFMREAPGRNNLVEPEIRTSEPEIRIKISDIIALNKKMIRNNRIVVEKVQENNVFNDKILWDISDGHIMFKDDEISLFIDNNKNVWFGAREVAIAIGYSNNNNTIKNIVQSHTNLEHRKEFHTFKSKKKIYHHRKQFINELGLTKFMYSSKMENSDEFANWMNTDIFPAIRKYQNN